MAVTSLSITSSILSSSHSSANDHHFLFRPFAIQFPFRFLSSSSTLSHRAIHLPPISAVKTPKKIKKIGSEITSLTLEEARVLVEYVHDKFGVSLVFSETPTATAIAPCGGEAASGVQKQTKFDVVMNQVPLNKRKRYELIKAIRVMASLSLREVKELIEEIPKALKEGVTKDEAEEAKKQLEEAGAEAKEFIEEHPKIFKEGVTKDEAEEAKK